MFAVIKILFALSRTKRGRRALKALFVYLNSAEGRRILAQARKVATGPEAQRVAAQVTAVVRAAAERTRAARGRQPQRRAWPLRGTSSGGGRRHGASAAGRVWQRARSVRAPR